MAEHLKKKDLLLSENALILEVPLCFTVINQTKKIGFSDINSVSNARRTVYSCATTGLCLDYLV